MLNASIAWKSLSLQQLQLELSYRDGTVYINTIKRATCEYINPETSKLKQSNNNSDKKMWGSRQKREVYLVHIYIPYISNKLLVFSGKSTYWVKALL